MPIRVRVDQKGRIVLPKNIREYFSIKQNVLKTDLQNSSTYVTLEEIKKLLEELKSEGKRIIDLNQLKLANSVFAIKFDDLNTLKKENARLKTRLAEYVERDKKAVELIDYYRSLVSTLPGIGNRIEKVLSTYKLKIPPEKFERFLHIATGSETAEMLLASAKSGAIGSEIEALKEALPKLQELKSVTSSLAEIIMLDPEKVSEILITL